MFLGELVDGGKVTPWRELPAGEEQSPCLHVFGQNSWHDEVHIVGNKAALSALLAAIMSALNGEGPAEADVAVNDGECYSAYVHCLPDAEMNAMAVPYSADEAREQRPEAVYPCQKNQQ